MAKQDGGSFIGNVMKYSIATYLGFGITGVAIIVKGILPAEVQGEPVTFMTYTASVMNLCILGLDQSLLRFYQEPPAGLTGRGLFASCLALSGGFTALLGVVGSLLFARPLAVMMGFTGAGAVLVPLLFVNAALYMVVRYLNVLLRLEGNIAAYTFETLWMQGCYNLFYLLPGFFTQNVAVLALAAVLSFGVVAIAFGFAFLRGTPRPTLPQLQAAGRVVLPYGIALAPAQILFTLNSAICLSFLANYTGDVARGLFSFGFSLAQLVTAIQAGFSTYWGPYVFAHYKEEQDRIFAVHDMLNLLIFGFFCGLVMFEDVGFWIFQDKAGCMVIFPLLMLGVVFNILCEGTVYGNAIAKKPYHDTVGIGLGALINLGLCALLVPRWGLLGAGLAIAVGNGSMFLYRTLTGQHFYRSIPSYRRTVCGFALAVAVAVAGCVFHAHFAAKLAAVGALLAALCVLYRGQLVTIWQFILGFFKKGKQA